MAYCRNCGLEVDADAKFCPQCGHAQDVPIPPEQDRIPTPNTDIPPASGGTQEVAPGTWTLRGAQIFFGGCCLLPILFFLVFFGLPVLAGLFFEHFREIAVAGGILIAVVGLFFLLFYWAERRA